MDVKNIIGLDDYIRENLSIEIRESNEVDFGTSSHVIKVTLRFKGDEISKDSVSLPSRD